MRPFTLTASMDVVNLSNFRIARILLNWLFKESLDIFCIDLHIRICLVGPERRRCQVIIVYNLSLIWAIYSTSCHGEKIEK